MEDNIEHKNNSKKTEEERPSNTANISSQPDQDSINAATNSAAKLEKNINKNANVNDNNLQVSDKPKPIKKVPLEKKPFQEFVNEFLIPSLIEEFKGRGFEIEEIILENTNRPIAGDKCWVLYCQIKDICNFWLSFEKEDIASTKSISLCKSKQMPSVIESFLIDEKRITLNLIISRIFQRLNGQKLIGVN